MLLYVVTNSVASHCILLQTANGSDLNTLLLDWSISREEDSYLDRAWDAGRVRGTGGGSS